MANFFRSVLAAARAILQSKTVTATTSTQTVTPDSGYDGLSQVTVNPQIHDGTSSSYTTNGTKDLGASHSIRYVDIDVPAPTLSGDAAASDVLSGKTFYNSDYTKRTGTITSKAAATYNTSSSDQTISSGQYLSGTQTIKAVTTENIDAANIKSGVTIKVGDANSAGRIKNVTGTYSGPTLSGDATTSDVLSGKTFYSDSYTKKTGTYTAPTITSITPSNTSPVSMSANNNYKPTASGYAISSYSSVTPSSSGASFSSGMVKMDGNGYAYSSRPSSGYNYGWDSSTLLWSNSSASSSFPQSTITLSSGMSNYSYLRIVYKASTSKTTEGTLIVPVSVMENSLWNDATKPLVSITGRANSSTAQCTRRITWISNTQINIAPAYQAGSTSSDNTAAIPLYVYGLK